MNRRDKATVQVGFGNSIMISRVIGIFSVDTNPVKKMISDAKLNGMVVDLTKDKKTKTAILMDNDYIILSPISHSAIISRINRNDTTMAKNLLDKY